MKNQAAILSDGSVNVELLVTEIQAELLNDAKYKAEDGMKKRAVQISKNYDEFKAFVACSQLKPIKGSELSQLATPFSQGRTSMIQRRSLNNKIVKVNSILEKSDDASRQNIVSGKNFTNGSLLEKDWRQTCRTLKEKTMYIQTRITPSKFVTLYQQTSLDPSFMSDLLSAIYQNISVEFGFSEEQRDPALNSSRCTSVLEWMEAFPQCESFNLNLMFMNTEEKNSVQRIIKWVEEGLSCDASYQERVHLLKTRYDLFQ